MSRRRRGLSATVALGAIGFGIGACSGDTTDNGCQITLETALPGTPLTLLPDARLDQVAGGFFLLGSDASAVRWAPLASDGTMGTEQAFSLPTGTSSPLVAAAGVTAPGDTILIASVGPASAGGSELDVVAAPAAGGQPVATVSAVLNFATTPQPGDVVMGSSRLGMVAGVAFIDRTKAVVELALLDGTGHLVVDPVALSSPAATPDAFSCLAFGPGKQALTVNYVTQLPAPATVPNTIGTAEATETGGVDTTQSTVAAELGCVRAAPTTNGYAWSWESQPGAYLLTLTGISYFGAMVFAPAASLGGAALEAPLAALAPFGTDFGVIFAFPYDIELWRIGPAGQRRPGALIFPSIDGNAGQVSALPVAGSLALTYPDYTTPPPAGTPVGRRLFLNAVCY